MTVDPATGNVTQVSRQDSLGALSLVLGYDSFGNVLSTNNGLASYASVTNSFGLYTTIFDARNPETRAYDSHGRVFTRNWAATGRTMTYTWDNYDRLTRVDDTAGPSILNAYDIASRLITRTVQPTDGSLSQITTYGWDDRDRLISVKDATGRLTQYGYQPINIRCNTLDQPSTITDPDNRTTYLYYDLRQRLIRSQDPNGGITRYEYYDDGDLLALTDADGNRTVFYYDANRRLIQRQRPSVMTNAQGNTVAATEVTNYQYDAAGRLVKESKVSAANSNMVLATTLTYDGLDHVVEKELTQELSGVVTELQDDSTFTYSRQLDAQLQTVANNSVEQLGFAHEAVPPFAMTGYTVKATDPSNALGLIQDTYTLTPDVTGQMASIANSAAQTLWNAQYDSAGRLAKIASGNYIPVHSLTSTITLDAFARKRGVVHSTGMIGSYSYDLLNRITSLYWNGLDGTGATQNFSEFPTYDPLTGDITGITREFGKFEYGYNALDELTSSAYTGHTALGAAANRSDQFDWTGNRMTDSLRGQGTFLANFLTSDNVAIYQADANGFGDLTQKTSFATGDVNSYSYRADNQMTLFFRQVDEDRDFDHGAEDPIVRQAQYQRDALGRMVAKQISLNPVNRHHCSKHEHQAVSFVQSYIYLGDRSNIMLGKAGNGTVTLYLDHVGAGATANDHLGDVSESGAKSYVADHLGSIINSIAAGGAPAYGSYGENLGTRVNLSVSSPALIRGFAGMSFDSVSGLHETPFREFDSHSGRWTTTDPLGPVMSTNLYEYASNRPLSLEDPSGLYFVTTDPGSAALLQGLMNSLAPYPGSASYQMLYSLAVSPKAIDISLASQAYITLLNGQSAYGYTYGSTTTQVLLLSGLANEMDVSSYGDLFHELYHAYEIDILDQTSTNEQNAINAQAGYLLTVGGACQKPSAP